MTEELEGEAICSILIERIKKAFADVPHPGDDGIIGTPEHVAVCDECSDLRQALVGRRWTDLVDDA